MISEQATRPILLLSMLGLGLLGCSGQDAPGTGSGDNAPGAGTGGSISSAAGGQAASGGLTSAGGDATLASGGSPSGAGSGAGGRAPSSGGAPTSLGGAPTSSGGAPTSAGGAGGVAGMSPGAGRGGSLSAGGSEAVGGHGGEGGAGAGRGGSSALGGAAGGSGTGSTATCTASKPANSNAKGSGPHQVVVETNSDPGIKEGTIFRPADLGGDEKYPIFVWGEGGCSQDGLSNASAMAEIASYGYFVVADGTPNGSGNRPMDRSKLAEMGAPLIAYIDWAIAENDKPCSAYYQSLATTKIAANGFSCGGLMSQAVVTDPRIVTWGVNSSGMAGATQDFYDLIHTPVLFVEGGPDDIAYDGGMEGYQAIAKLDVPVIWFSKPLGHGGDLFSSHGGDFTKIDLAWLNWWLKGDETATGKGLLVGSGCPYCSDSAWEVMSHGVP